MNKPHYKTSTAKRYEYDGQLLTIRELADTYGMPLKTIQSRFCLGWDVVRVMETPLHAMNGRRYKWRTDALRAGALRAERARCAAIGEKPPRTIEDMPLSRDPWSQGAIDFAVEMGGLTLDAVGHIQGGVTRERVRQVEESAKRKIRAVVGNADRETIIELLRGLDQARRDQDPFELEEPMGSDWMGRRRKAKEDRREKQEAVQDEPQARAAEARGSEQARHSAGPRQAHEAGRVD